MLATALIAFREFFEAFLIVGVFLGVSRKLDLKKELEIGLAAGSGMALALLLVVLVYIFGADAGNLLTERNADFLESYLLIFSGVFIAYVVFSLHETMNKSRSRMISAVQGKLEQKAFDVSLFLTIIFLILREGFEVALFTASISLFTAFVQNVIGLLAGFALAAALGLLMSFAYTRLPIGKIFKATEYFLILIGSWLLESGVTGLFETHFGIHLSYVVQAATMLVYIACVYFLFIKPRAVGH